MSKKAARRHLARAERRAEVIAWRDHAEPTDKGLWDRPTPAADLWPHVVFTVGFILEETAGIVEVCRDLSEHGSVGACLHILKKEIIYRHPVKVPTVDKTGMFNK